MNDNKYIDMVFGMVNVFNRRMFLIMQAMVMALVAVVYFSNRR